MRNTGGAISSNASSTRTLHFTAQGFKSQLIEIAPDFEEPQSKRYGSIEQEDKELNSNLVELEVGTKARNRAYQDRLDEVWASTAGYDAKLRIEAAEAAETIIAMREEYQRHIDKFSATLQEEIKIAFDKVDLELLPMQFERLDVVRQGVDVFVNETVPAAIERQSGEVSRRLKKAYETFDIEKQKERKREVKFVNKASEFIQNTAQRFKDENALMTANIFILEDDVIESERRSARMFLRRNDLAVHAIVEIKDIVAKESQIRASEDAELLDVVIETQKLLQQTVLEHFGSERDSDLPPVPVRMEKLEQRMSRRNSRALTDSERDIGGAGEDASSGDVDQGAVDTEAV